MEVVDYIEHSRPLLDTHPKRTVYVARSTYDADLRESLPTFGRVRKQLRLDIPRCNFWMDGMPIQRPPRRISLSLSRYCTQAVMGLPLTLLCNSDSTVIAERTPPSAMCVDIWNSSLVIIRKQLRIWSEVTPMQLIDIAVVVDDDCDVVVITLNQDA